MSTLPVAPKPILNFGNVSSMEQVASENQNLKPYAQTVADDYLQVKQNPTDLNIMRKYATDVATLAAHEGIDGGDPTEMSELQNGIVSSLQSAGVSQDDIGQLISPSSPST